MSGRLRWGILGAGWIATKFARDLSYGVTGRVSRVASRDFVAAQALARACAAQASESFEAMLRADDVDAVYIATPAVFHHLHVIQALSRGKPVLCEKPFALNAEEAREIVEAARRARCFCMEGMWTRFLPTMNELRGKLKRNELGDISQMSVDLGFVHNEESSNATLTDPALGGGALLDLGIYGVSLAHDLLGMPREIQAEAVISPTGSVRDVSITFLHEKMKRPALCSIRASHSTELRNALDISGSRGRISVDAPFIRAIQARMSPLGPRGRTAERPSALGDALRGSRLWPVARGLARRATGREGVAFGRPFVGYGLRFEAEEVARCLAAGQLESPVMPLSESVEVLESVDRISALISDRGVQEGLELGRVRTVAE